MTSRTKVARSLLCAVVLLALAPHASASATFPDALRKKLGLAEIVDPPLGCQLCHQTDAGGLKTATKPFGRAMLANGAVGGSVPSMLAALTALEANGTDSDHDGVSDIDELKAGTDPNVAMFTDGTIAPTGPEVPLPETGCALSGAKPRDAVVAPLGFAFLALLLAARRRGA